MHLALLHDGDSTLNGELHRRLKRNIILTGIATPTEAVAPSRRRFEPAVTYLPPEIAPLDEYPSPHPSISRPVDAHKSTSKYNDTALILLDCLSLDLSIRSARPRRLSTYYAMTMLLRLQVESVGHTSRLQTIIHLNDEAFDAKLKAIEGSVAEMGRIAVTELLTRLYGSSRYRIISTGPPKNTIVPITAWLRTALPFFGNA